MKKLLFALTLLSHSIFSFGQCPDTIHVCGFGYTHLDIDLPQGNNQIQLTNSTFDPNPKPPVDLYGFNGSYTFKSPWDFSEWGVYTIYNKGIKVCEGIFKHSSCIDRLMIDEMPGCFSEGYYECTNDDIPNNWDVGRRHVCVGDTSLITISSIHNYGDRIQNEQFNPNRLEINNGSIVSFDDNSFNILWEKAGSDCMILETTKYEDTFLSSLLMEVLPSDTIKIIRENNMGSSSEICLGQNISLRLESESSLYAIWYISDGRTLQGLRNEISFNTPGVYTIRVTNNQSCQCTKDAIYTVTVLPGETPEITCLRTVCQGEEATYYSTSQCEEYLWNISSGGTITEGGGINDNSVSVLWNDGPLEEISLSTPDCQFESCEIVTSEIINVIIPNVQISGPDTVCEYQISNYFAPAYTGTEFNWSIDGRGLIIGGRGTNSIQVKWYSILSTKKSIIRVEYENCNADCGGFAEFEVNLLPEFKLKYNFLKVCIDQNILISNTKNIPLDWTYINEIGELKHFNSLTNLSLSFAAPGNYKLSAHNPFPTTCNKTEEIILQVQEPIPPPLGLIGPRKICLDKTVQYSIPNLANNQIAVWSVYDGSNVPSFNAESTVLNYTWSSEGPYEIYVYIKNTLSSCRGDGSLFEINAELELLGVNSLCVGENAIYTINEYFGGEVVWEITPNSAGYIQRSFQQNCEIVWAESGDHTLVARYCGLESTLEISIHSYPEFQLQYDSLICVDEKSELIISSNAGETFSVIDKFGSFIGSFSPMQLDTGKYEIVKTNEFGCRSNTKIDIDTFPSFTVEISSPDATIFCGVFNPVSIEVSPVSSDHSYQWYNHGLPISEFNATFQTNEYGLYHVIVTDENGCTAKSNTHRLFECCGASFSESGPLVHVDQIDISCTEKIFEVIPPFASTVFEWYFGDNESGVNNRAIGRSVSHKFSHAGIFRVSCIGNGACETINASFCGQEYMGTKCEGRRLWVTIPIVADFESEAICLGDTISFLDISTKYPQSNSIKYFWNFGDPGSGISNVSSEPNPMHLFSASGDYDIQLIVEENSGCKDTIIKTIHIEESPLFEITSNSKYCLGALSEFSLNTTELIKSYSWDFGDPNSGYVNSSNEAFPTHVFSDTGTFVIKLIAKTFEDCSLKTSVSIKIKNNVLVGDIVSDLTFPKCPEDSVSLSAMDGNLSYLWSTGETTQTINVLDPNTFNVTVTDDYGCEYSPFPISVINSTISSAVIYAEQEIYPSNSTLTSYDTLTVCDGRHFDLLCSKVTNAEYNWSNGYVEGHNLSYYPHFNKLDPGTYNYSVSIFDSLANCERTIGPFVVEILDIPNPINIVSENNYQCENQDVLLKVEPYHPDYSYTWSTGDTSPSINVIAAGRYYLTVSNKNGCSRLDSYIVSTAPSDNEWMTGCLDVCFPEYFCISLSYANDYRLFKNGKFLKILNSNIDFFTLEEPGDYQLEIENNYGCKTLSGYLSVSSLPIENVLSGIVFIDENQNDIFDNIDYYLEDQLIYLINNNVVIDSVLTDQFGYYEFQQVGQLKWSVKLADVSNDYLFEGNQHQDFVFIGCEEEKNIDFPLHILCENKITESNYQICPGESILVNGKEYFANNRDTLVYQLHQNCDSIILIHVAAHENPPIFIEQFPSCVNHENGSINVHSYAPDSLMFSLNENDPPQPDSVFNDLPIGEYLFYIHQNGCVFKDRFNILQVDAPEIIVTTEPSCYTEYSGSIQIDAENLDELIFKLALDSSYSSQTVFNHLNAGTHTIYFQDAHGCLYEFETFIEETPQMQINLQIDPSCEGTNNGQVAIESQQGEPISLLDDEINFSSNNSYQNLEAGSHLLLYKNEYGCLDSLYFDIPNIPAPVYSLDLTSACENLSFGSLNVSSNDSSILLAVDNSEFDSSTLFKNLGLGIHNLYLQTSEGCVFETIFEIESIATPELDINTMPSCLNESNGHLSISNINIPNLEFSLDGISFQSDLEFYNLDAGQQVLFVSNLSCIYEFPFGISELQEPIFDLEIYNTCKGSNDGQISLQIIEGSNLEFQIENLTGFSNELSYSNLDAGNYNLIIRNELGCTYSESFIIENFDDPQFDITTNSTCFGQSNGSIYIENVNGDVSFSLNTTQNFGAQSEYNLLAPGVHNLYSLSTFGCLDSLQITIESFEQPLINLESIASCEGYTNGMIQVLTQDENLEYALDGINYSSSINFENLESGPHTIYIKNLDGCIYSKAFDIAQLAKPNLILNTENTCEGETNGQLQIDQSPNAPLSYSLNGENYFSESEINLLAAGDYTLFVQNELACTYEYSFSIKSNPLPILEIESENTCPDSNSGSISIINSNSKYFYSIEGAPFTNEIYFDNLTLGTYQITVVDSALCENQMLVEIRTHPKLLINFPDYDLDCYEDEVLIQAEIQEHHGKLSYRWSEGSSGSQLKITDSGEYELEISDQCETQSHKWNINILPSEADKVYIPNVFSPNGDEINDCFKVFAKEGFNFQEYSLMLFDRWGNLLFTSKDPDQCWDGVYRNKALNPGVYVYVFEMLVVKCDGIKTLRKSGDVTIVR